MFSYNRVQIIGYQTQPVNVRQTPSGASVTDLNIVTPYQFRSDSGEDLSGKGFHTVTLWGPMAEVAGQYLRPGAQVFISGRLQTDSWEDEKSGEKRSKTKIVGMDMILLDPKDGQIPAPEGSNITNALNRVDIVGNVTRDPELRTTTSGRQVLTLGVATNDRWKDKTSGEMKERAEFHNVVIWGELAEEAQKSIKKGNRIFASGRVQTRSWETQDGSKRTTTEIIAENISLLGVQNAVADESVQTDSAPAAASTPAPAAPVASEAPAQPAEQEVPSVPEVQHKSEVKVEDLPF
jgi:single-strand DNA-binding protein